MGFYAPAQLIQDARRHGVEVLPVDVAVSGWESGLEYGSAPPVGQVAPAGRYLTAAGTDALRQVAAAPQPSGAYTTWPPEPPSAPGKWTSWPPPMPWRLWPVTAARRPGTASGVIFVTLEDETGMTNVVVHAALAERQRRELLGARLLGVYGQVQREGRVVHLLARRLVDLSQIGRASCRERV